MNPLDSFSLTMLNESFDLIIGNVTPASQKNLFKYTDINLTTKDIAFIGRQIQKKGIRNLQQLNEQKRTK